MTTKTSEKAPKKQQTPTYLSDMRPQFEPAEIDCGKINLFRYKGGLKSELKARSITPQEAVAIYEDMLDDHLLHFADHEHVLVNRDRLLGRDGAGLEFGFEAALVAEQVDLATVDLCGLELGPHVAEIRGRLLLLRGFL